MPTKLLAPIYLCIASFLLTTLCINAQPGTIDSTFAVNGLARYDFFGTNFCEMTEILPDGKILQGGSRESNWLLFVRYLPNGTIDSTFGEGGSISPYLQGVSLIPKVHLQTDGKLLVGDISNFKDKLLFARYDQNGKIDSTFGVNGVISYPFVARSNSDIYYPYRITTDLGGRIFLTGMSINDKMAVLCLQPNGKIDYTFANNGYRYFDVDTLKSSGQSLTPLPDGKMIFSGFTNVPGGGDLVLVKLTANGQNDSTFGTNGMVTVPIGTGTPIGTRIKTDTSGNIYVSGHLKIDSTVVLALIKFDSTGLLDQNYGSGGIATAYITGDDHGGMFDFQSDGKVVVGGQSGNYGNGNSTLIMVRFTTDGQLDSTFGTNGITHMEVGQSVGIRPQLKILKNGQIIYGNWARFNSAHFILMRFNNDISLGIQQGEQREQVLLIYPNPAQEIIKIDHSTMAKWYSIQTLDGRAIQYGNFLEDIHIDHLVKGMYMVYLLGEKRELIGGGRFIKD